MSSFGTLRPMRGLNRRSKGFRAVVAVGVLGLASCGDDGGGTGTEADRLGVGAQCTASEECLQVEGEPPTSCLLQFAGGYCGLSGCAGDEDCPRGSACVAHDDGATYCFLICRDKLECNANREADNAANCSSNVTYTDGAGALKACVPPSSG